MQSCIVVVCRAYDNCRTVVGVRRLHQGKRLLMGTARFVEHAHHLSICKAHVPASGVGFIGTYARMHACIFHKLCHKLMA